MYLDKLLAVHLHVLDVNVPPLGGVPVSKAALHQSNHIPQTIQHHYLPVEIMQFAQLTTIQDS